MREGMYRKIPIDKAIEALDDPSVVDDWLRFVNIDDLDLL